MSIKKRWYENDAKFAKRQQQYEEKEIKKQKDREVRANIQRENKAHELKKQELENENKQRTADRNSKERIEKYKIQSEIKTASNSKQDNFINKIVETQTKNTEQKNAAKIQMNKNKLESEERITEKEINADKEIEI